MQFDAVVIGAGAAGLFCAGVAGQRGLKVLVLDHSDKVAEKIRISGGGRANFTNRDIDVRAPHRHFISDNPNFCRSALSRYTPQQFLNLVNKHGIGFHEKHKGQLFCDRSADDLIQMLLAECAAGGVQRWQPCAVHALRHGAAGYEVDTDRGTVLAASVVVAIAPSSRYTYSIDTLANGALPGGMTIDLNGVLSGRPSVTGRTDMNGNQIARTYTFGVCATDTITRVMTTPCPQTSITVNPAPVACSYTYSGWSVCAAGQQSRSVLSATPAGCTGTPVTSQACTSTPASSACYYCQFDVNCTVYGRGGCWRCSTSSVVAGTCQAPSTALVTYGSTCVADPALYQVCQ